MAQFSRQKKDEGEDGDKKEEKSAATFNGTFSILSLTCYCQRNR